MTLGSPHPRNASSHDRRRFPRRLVLLLLALLLGMAGGVTAPDAEAADKKALDEYFKGKVIALDGKTVTLRYDFSKKEQLKDFTDNVPWPIEKRKDQGIKWFDERMEVVGNSGARHVAEWAGDVLVKARVTLDGDRDIGGWLSPVNGADDYATFTLREFFFHTWNGKTGGQNSIIKFGKQWREKGSSNDYIGFRYVDRRPPKAKVEVGATQDISFGLQEKKLVMTSPGQALKGKDRGKKLKKYFVGLYAIKCRALFDNVEITGRLNDEWLRHVKVELRTSKPLTGPSTGPTLDEETLGLIAEHKTGKGTKPTRKLIEILKDVGVARPVREAVRDGLSEGSKKTVRYAQDLLYSRELEVRQDGIAIIKAHVGKDWGFNPKGSESSRSKAIQAMNDELKKKPSMLDD